MKSKNRVSLFNAAGRPQRQSGVTLVEGMVAFLILGVGLLGIMAMQNSALRHNQNGYLYSQANFAIQDITERMRANTAGVDDSEYITGLEDAAPAVDADKCISSACNPKALAEWDLKLWKTYLSRSLPDGKGGIRRVGDEFEITVRFDDSRGEDDPREVIRVVEI